MFERYTEKARRCIFFARYEASQQGTPYIEVDHLLLALLREGGSLFDPLLTKGAKERMALGEEVRSLRTPSTTLSIGVDVPLSHGAKRVLVKAAEQAERFGHKHIDTMHLLVGVLREPSLADDVLRQHDLTPGKLELVLAGIAPKAISASKGSASSLGAIQQEFRMLTTGLTHDIEPAPIFRLS